MNVIVAIMNVYCLEIQYNEQKSTVVATLTKEDL